LTAQFTESAINFVKWAPTDQPYFLYLANTSTHEPYTPSSQFKGVSGYGDFADSLLEFDWSVGELMRQVQTRDLEQGTNTMILFLSDNGELVGDVYENERGSNWPLSGGKFTTKEGGIRVPFIVSLPGVIPEGLVNNDLASIMDIKPTLGNFVGSDIWHIGETDGKNILSMMTGVGDMEERLNPILHFNGNFLECATKSYSIFSQRNVFKIRFVGLETDPKRPKLFNVTNDLAEENDISSNYPEIVFDIIEGVKRELNTFPKGLVNSTL
jgi:arylsulfatase